MEEAVERHGLRADRRHRIADMAALVKVGRCSRCPTVAEHDQVRLALPPNCDLKLRLTGLTSLGAQRAILRLNANVTQLIEHSRRSQRLCLRNLNRGGSVVALGLGWQCPNCCDS